MNGAANAGFHGRVWGPDGGGFHNGGVSRMDPVQQTPPRPGTEPRFKDRSETRRDARQDRSGILAAVSRVFGFDVRARLDYIEGRMDGIEDAFDALLGPRP